jgi:hypothetical protein
MRILIIIPAYNEGKSIERVVNELVNNYPEYDYIVINDCSKDDTAVICKKNDYNFIDLPINLGIGGCVQTGYKYAHKNDYDIAIQYDGDGQHDAGYLESIIQPILYNMADIVIGSRFMTKKGFQSTWFRRSGILFLGKLIHILTGEKVKDVTSGFRAVNKKMIQFYANNYAQDYPEPEAIVAGSLLGARIKEVPVIMRERYAGSSSISSLKGAYYMLKVSLAIIVLRMSLHRGLIK